MLKNYKWEMIITSILILLPIAAGLSLWNRLPDEMATHWNAQGIADGFLPKGVAVLGLPLFLLAVHWICFTVTIADPGNRGQSSALLHLILYICPLVSLQGGTLTYAQALGMEIQTVPLTQIMIGILFILLGNYLPKCRQNHTLGIKIPWTLQDEDNWNRTHRMAGPVWVIGGIIIAGTAFWDTIWILLILLPVIAGIPTLYSYLYYRRKGKG